MVYKQNNIYLNEKSCKYSLKFFQKQNKTKRVSHSRAGGTPVVGLPLQASVSPSVNEENNEDKAHLGHRGYIRFDNAVVASEGPRQWHRDRNKVILILKVKRLGQDQDQEKPGFESRKTQIYLPLVSTPHRQHLWVDESDNWSPR